jgi:hypothetical protein
MAPSDRSTGRVQRYARRIYWACAALSVAVGAFLVVDVVSSSDHYRGGAWLGVALSAAAVLTMILVYVGCALGRFRLEQHLVGKMTLFHLTVAALVLAVGADVLIPARNSGGLALLLPWGISYWFHSMTKDGSHPAD